MNNEVERLRKALQDIIELAEQYQGDEWPTPAVASDFSEIAKEALDYLARGKVTDNDADQDTEDKQR